MKVQTQDYAIKRFLKSISTYEGGYHMRAMALPNMYPSDHLRIDKVKYTDLKEYPAGIIDRIADGDVMFLDADGIELEPMMGILRHPNKHTPAGQLVIDLKDISNMSRDEASIMLFYIISNKNKPESKRLVFRSEVRTKVKEFVLNQKHICGDVNSIYQTEGYQYYINNGIFFKRAVSKNEYFLSAPSAQRKMIAQSAPDFKFDILRGKLLGQEKALLNKPDTPEREQKLKSLRQELEQTYLNDIEHPYSGYIPADNAHIGLHRSIVIDIDNHHECTEHVKTQVDKLFDLIYTKDLGVIRPDHFVYTGSGAQLWFVFDPVPAVLGWKVSIVQQQISDEYKKLLEGYNVDMEVDMGASTRLAGFYRLPGTINARNGVRSILYNHHIKATRSLDDLGLQAGIDVRRKEQNVRFTRWSPIEDEEMVESSEQYIPRKKHTGSPTSRIQILHQIISDRDGDCVGIRNYLLHLLASEYKRMEYEDIKDRLAADNQLFSVPLTEREVASLARHAFPWNYSRHRISEILGLSEQEQEKYGLSGVYTTYTYQKIDHTERNNNIINLKKSGASDRAVSLTLKISRTTVKRIWTEYVTVSSKKAEAIRERMIAIIRNKQTNDNGYTEFPISISFREVSLAVKGHMRC